MAERYAVATGVWSATGTWDGGTLPTSGDTVHANNFTVTIDQDVTAVSLRTDAGATAVIQPGGSKRDAEVIDACDAAGVAMAFTGRRHFRH